MQKESPTGASRSQAQARTEVANAPVLCRASCGFFGHAQTSNYCSKCFKELGASEAAAAEDADADGSDRAPVREADSEAGGATLNSKGGPAHQERAAIEDARGDAEDVEVADGGSRPSLDDTTFEMEQGPGLSATDSPLNAGEPALAASSPDDDATPEWSPAGVGACTGDGAVGSDFMGTPSPRKMGQSPPGADPAAMMASPSEALTEIAAGTTGSMSAAADRSGAPGKPRGRCALPDCKKKVGLIGFDCDCGGRFCNMHRTPEEHDCSFDFHGEAVQKLGESVVKLTPEKLERLE